MLFTILLLILLLVLFVPTLVLSVITRILSVFNFKSHRNTVHRRREQYDTSTYNTDDTDTGKKKKAKKIFDKDEGEYVDFEEIK